MERKHCDNYLVAQVTAMKGVDRARGLKRLKNLGAFHHNVDVLRRGHGELIVARRTTGKHSSHAYLPCGRCYGFYFKHDLWRHACPCVQSSSAEEKPVTSSSAVVESARCLLDGAVDADSAHTNRDLKKHVLHHMRQDKKYDIIRSDELIMQFGTSLLKRVGVKGRRRIASRMRLLAGLLGTVRNLLNKPEQRNSLLLIVWMVAISML